MMNNKREYFGINNNGYTRIVLFVGNYVIKIPSVRNLHKRMGVGAFLLGLKSNKQEHKFNKVKWVELCPVKFYIPGGLLLIMSRASPLCIDDWKSFCYDKFVTRGCPEAKKVLNDHNGDVSRVSDPSYLVVPSENKIDSYGYYKGRIVAVDYGGYR